MRARFIRKSEKFHRIGARRPVGPDLRLALGDGGCGRPRHGQAAEIALDVHEQGLELRPRRAARQSSGASWFFRCRSRRRSARDDSSCAAGSRTGASANTFPVTRRRAEQNRVALERIAALNGRHEIAVTHGARIGFCLRRRKLRPSRSTNLQLGGSTIFARTRQAQTDFQLVPLALPRNLKVTLAEQGQNCLTKMTEKVHSGYRFRPSAPGFSDPPRNL